MFTCPTDCSEPGSNQWHVGYGVGNTEKQHFGTWWRHLMETFSALLVVCVRNSPVIGEFPSQRPVTRSFDVSLICALNKRLSEQSWGWWFETPSQSLWRHCHEHKLWQFQKRTTKTLIASCWPYYLMERRVWSRVLMVLCYWQRCVAALMTIYVRVCGESPRFLSSRWVCDHISRKTQAPMIVQISRDC